MDLLLNNVAAVYLPHEDHLMRLRNLSIGIQSGKIVYMDDSKDVPPAKKVIDAQNFICLPALIDPHTHSVWGGSRAKEFARRLAGENYTKILEEGGGILSTVTQTRNQSLTRLSQGCRYRLRPMLQNGVGTVEVKSGYGLNPATEQRLLMAARTAATPQQITTTFLGAHTIPKEYRGRRDQYVRQIIEEQLPVCAPYADSIDVYCDRGAFTLDESIEILKAGKSAGL
ncbi:MAG: imidazolonepropionase, partial [Myxococcota bacterium]|nr:imidazolonepropionase [Myxococcota bacterium]